MKRRAHFASFEPYEFYDNRRAVKLAVVRNGLIRPLSARAIAVLCDASTVVEGRSQAISQAKVGAQRHGPWKEKSALKQEALPGLKARYRIYRARFGQAHLYGCEKTM